MFFTHIPFVLNKLENTYLDTEQAQRCLTSVVGWWCIRSTFFENSSNSTGLNFDVVISGVSILTQTLQAFRKFKCYSCNNFLGERGTRNLFFLPGIHKPGFPVSRENSRRRIEEDTFSNKIFVSVWEVNCCLFPGGEMRKLRIDQEEINWDLIARIIFLVFYFVLFMFFVKLGIATF